MSRRIDLLDEIKDYFFSGEEKLFNYINKEEVKKLFDKMLKYYEINDMESGFIHSKIFSALYLCKENLSYDSVAEKFYLHIYTLDRYRQRYNKLAKKLLDKIIEYKRTPQKL